MSAPSSFERVADEAVGGGVTSGVGTCREYCEAYGVYARVLEVLFRSLRGDDASDSRVERLARCFVPPMWCGRGVFHGVDCGVDGCVGTGVGDVGKGSSARVVSDVVPGAGVSVGGERSGDAVCSGVDDVKETVVGGAQVDGGPVLGLVRGKNYEKNRAKRERRKRLASDWRSKDSGVCVSDESDERVGSTKSVETVDTRTAVEIEAAQSLARRRIAENELAVVQANRKVKSLCDEKKTLAFERLQGARLSQRINQANVAAQKAYAARDKSLTSVDSAGSAGEYAMRQDIKAARNSQFINDYLRKQIDIFAKHADPSVIAAADRVPKPTLDDMYEVMKDQYDLTDPEQCAQLDADVAVENAKWNDVLYSGEGFMDEPASVKKPESGETLEELYAKVRAEDEKFDVAQREIDAANRE